MRRQRPNIVGSAFVLLWLAIIALPILSLLITAFTREFQLGGLTSIASGFTLDNYKTVLNDGIVRYVVNSIIVTGSSVALTLAVAVPLSFYLVRSKSRLSQLTFRTFLFGLAIPAQAIIIPLYLVISQLGLYDTLLAIVLPTAAFALPVSVLVLTAGMREVPRDLYEAMEIDGASTRRMFFWLVLPLSRSSIATVAIFTALQAWNGFLFPFILTQSPASTVVPLGLYTYIGRYAVNVPALFSAVSISAIPVFILYMFARRSLVRGLTGVGGK